MADADDVRELALALPHVVEIESEGFDFRVDNKGFVWSYPERRPGKRREIRTDIAVLYVGDEAEKQALLLGEPAVFFTTPGYDGTSLSSCAGGQGQSPHRLVARAHSRRHSGRWEQQGQPGHWRRKDAVCRSPDCTVWRNAVRVSRRR